MLSQQKAKVLTGNVYSPEGKPLADGYTIINKGGVKIGVIGMVTPNITRWDAKNLEGWTVTNPVDESRKIIDKIKDEVDVILGVMHMDTDTSTASTAPASPIWPTPARSSTSSSPPMAIGASPT